MKNKPYFVLIIAVALLVSCNNKQSLQEFYIAKQNDTNYKAIDLPTSLLLNEESILEPEQKEALETIKKVNIVAFPFKEGKQEAIDQDRAQVAEILGDEKYNFLIKYGSPERRAELYYLGEEEAIDELIVVGFDEKQGFAVARVLGEDMNPGAIMKLLKSLDGKDVNSEGFEQVKTLFLE